jgi:hypothetical protein
MAPHPSARGHIPIRNFAIHGSGDEAQFTQTAAFHNKHLGSSRRENT